jgi:hypothetical protein
MEIESMLNQSTPDIRKCTQLLQQYNSGFINILITLTNQANQFLDVFFKETRIEFRLSDYEQTPLQIIKKGSKYLLAEPQLFLDVWFADVKIENPHHFLNEARLSAIAISLYFAALTIMPPAPLSLLMLDDVLIGIDLANRMSVLKILTSHPFNQWQIILLTHDKIWYNIIQRYTSDLNTWACYEMYLDKQSRYPLTTIKPFKTALTLAKEHLQQNEIYVTNDVSLGNETNGILLYGTNAVGKTSFIRALGISIILAQSGMFVPCSQFQYVPYRSIFSRILGNDNIFKGLSTFAVEMSELRIILKMADEGSLILGDELCSGTESESALSIFVAGLQQLHERNSTFIFATHFHEIVHYEEIK